MADIVNLRTARKQAERRKGNERAKANRLTHGVPRGDREREQTRREQAQRQLDGHRRGEPGNDGSPA